MKKNYIRDKASSLIDQIKVPSQHLQDPARRCDNKCMNAQYCTVHDTDQCLDAQSVRIFTSHHLITISALIGFKSDN
jgi:hypothetical protein